jgi:hypothetical protein
MKTIIVAELAVLLAASACGDARGATPDAGVTFAYSSRQQVKCNTVTMQANDPPGVIAAECANVDDLPLTGSCARPGIGTEILKDNGPLAWEGTFQAPASWVCGWLSASGYVTIPGATATICCVVKGQ